MARRPNCDQPMSTRTRLAACAFAGLLALRLSGADGPAQTNFSPPLNLGTLEDHKRMMDLLQVASLRPMTNGMDPSSPDYANYDETKATAKSPVPDVLVLKSGSRIATPQDWWSLRRPQIMEDFDREVYGRIPEAAKEVKVTWTVTATSEELVGDIPVVHRTLRGHVDNSSYPLIDVNITASVTTPAGAVGRVPVMIEFGSDPFGGTRAPPPNPLGPDTLAKSLGLTAEQAAAIRPLATEILRRQNDAAVLQARLSAANTGLEAKISAHLTEDQQPQLARIFRARAARDTGLVTGSMPWQQLVLAQGWGFGSLNPNSIQPDTGRSLTSAGIIALVNQGQGRKPDDWGALRAWAWGAGRLIDFFETDPLVDAKQVGFEGISRYGKAVIVAMAYEPRAAVAFVGSAGEAGTKLYRHLMGETVENLASHEEYHWMAGNIIKYGGPLTVDDLPVDAHELIALCAPRPVFVSCGTGDGDAWQDPHGMFMAAALASPVYELLGKRGLGISQMPDPGVLLTQGELAFRQHEQGHTNRPNWPVFVEFAARYLRAPVGAPETK